MGLRKSFQRRLRLVRGESGTDALRILFANKETRRLIEYEKFGRVGFHPVGSQVSSPLLSRFTSFGGVPSGTLIDRNWYAETHGIQNASQTASHFMSVGVREKFAPNPAMAGEDSIHLAHWAIECLLRAGFQIGSVASGPLLPGSTDAIKTSDIENPGNKKIAVVTGIFGGFDRLLPINPLWSKEADFYLFSDHNYEDTSGWTQVISNYHNADPRRCARYVKMRLPVYFADKYDWVIWLDGNILLCAEPSRLIEEYDLDAFEFATFRHPERTSLISEAAACMRFGKESPMIVAKHLAKLSDHPGFADHSCFETWAVFLRPERNAVQTMCKSWWRIMQQGSRRDQLGLPIAVAETPKLDWTFLPEVGSESRFLYRTEHAKVS